MKKTARNGNPAALTRRQALMGFGSLAAASPLVGDQAPELIGEPSGHIAPRTDLVNVLEFENMAKRSLAPAVFATIAGSDRAFFDRITFRPRMMVPTTHLDLSLELFGEKMFAPVIAGPMAKLQTYHPDGESAMVRAASSAKAWMVVSSESSMPLEKIAAESSTVLWYQVFPDNDLSVLQSKIDLAIKSGCKAVCITAGVPVRNTVAGSRSAKPAGSIRSSINWNGIDQVRKRVSVPVLIKGIMTPEETQEAVKRGIQGIVVSNYGGFLVPGMAPAIEMLPSISDAAGGKVPVLIDGSFRRGSDIFKALACGATAVMIGRPLVWGLAAYGQEGAQQVLEMLQTEVARDMAHTGKPALKDIDRTVVRLHDV
jgi:isopentenyl diphosphate isomerase/L-lactate dehydrogenase-like FMN-dependent dehydrogenase